jgi:hypothetical protein
VWAFLVPDDPAGIQTGSNRVPAGAVRDDAPVLRVWLDMRTRPSVQVPWLAEDGVLGCLDGLWPRLRVTVRRPRREGS